MASDPLQRLDSFPYRHRLRDVMTRPAIVVPADLSLTWATQKMEEARSSALLIAGSDDDRPLGIITERDVLSAIARHGAGALDRPIRDFMSSPVETLPEDAMVYQVIGRMERLRLRHIAAVDEHGQIAGIVTVRGLLEQRVTKALALGDGIAVAPDAAALRALRDTLPRLARDLLGEGLDAFTIAGVLSDVLRATTGRAAELAERALAEEGLGPPPASYSVLVLGSAGRGETLLAPDQDHALIHAGGAEHDRWFQRLGDRLSRILAEAGVPFCKGGVMSSESLWRHNVTGWREQVGRWVGSARPEHLLSVDVFFDFQPVHGERWLGRCLRAAALERCAVALPFLKMLSLELESYSPPLGPFGGFHRPSGSVEVGLGRIELKLSGLFPVVAGARVMALRHRIGETSTPSRLESLAQAGRLVAADRDQLTAGHELVLRLILGQQIADLEAGRPAGSWVDVKALDRGTRDELRHALRRFGTVPAMVRDSLAA